MRGSIDSVRPASRLTIDGMLAFVALVAVALVIGTLVPSVKHDQSNGHASGLYRLTGAEQLVVLEDYTYDLGGWDGHSIDRRDSLLGPVVRASGPEMTRVFRLPENTGQVRIQFDVIGLGTPEALTVVSEPQIEPSVAEGANGRLTYTLVLPDPGGAVTLTLQAEGGASWALDNLLVVADLSDDPA